MSTGPYAHTPGQGNGWQDLAEHLCNVANTAASFAEAFGLSDAGRVLGVTHDIGKLNPEFQDYLQRCHAANLAGERPKSRRVPHSIWGAAYLFWLARRVGLDCWEELCLPVLAHHSRLSEPGRASTDLLLFERNHHDSLREMHDYINSLQIRLDPPLRLPASLRVKDPQRDLRVRMLCSALVDADSLDAERHTDPAKQALRRNWPDLSDLLTKLMSDQERIRDRSVAINSMRDDIYLTCLAAARHEPGLFRVTVPTGGGKTRSVLAFALRHAIEHELRRIVIAQPYTSIIDQTADDYREILGADALLEHHSGIEPTSGEAQDAHALRASLATENWDAKLIVTTTVQLLESLFSDRRSRLRKLHNLARSVIVLDEVQALPVRLLHPTIDLLRNLATPVSSGGYGCTVVFCTATQPLYEQGPLASVFDSPEKEAITELVPDFGAYFDALIRVDYRYDSQPRTWADLAGEIANHDSAMVVANTRRDALRLIDELPVGVEVFHLSTLLCGAHRRAVLSDVRMRLAAQEPVVLVATQVVECGVDLDFPVVYRAIGPLDRIVQAAGRANRNARHDRGLVTIFEPEDGGQISGPYATATEITRFLLRQMGADSLHSPGVYTEYFRLLFTEENLDDRGIQTARTAMDFPAVGSAYRLIDKETVPVVVPYGDWRRRLAAWTQRPDRNAWQRLQPIIVGLYEHEVRRLGHWIVAEGDGLYRWLGGYDIARHTGIGRPVMGQDFSDPADLFV